MAKHRRVSRRSTSDATRPCLVDHLFDLALGLVDRLFDLALRVAELLFGLTSTTIALPSDAWSGRNNLAMASAVSRLSPSKSAGRSGATGLESPSQAVKVCFRHSA